VTSKQPNSGQGMTGVRTRSGLVKIKSGPVKMLQGRIYRVHGELTSRQGGRRGVVTSKWSIDQGMYLTERYQRERNRSRVAELRCDRSNWIRSGVGHGCNSFTSHALTKIYFRGNNKEYGDA